MMIIKWRKDETEEEPFYNLYACTDTDYEMLIGYIGWDGFTNRWILSYNIPPLHNKFIAYEYYKINEIDDVLFRALLDIQSELSKINNMCIEYCDAISDYAIDYVQGVNHNED